MRRVCCHYTIPACCVALPCGSAGNNNQLLRPKLFLLTGATGFASHRRELNPLKRFRRPLYRFAERRRVIEYVVDFALERGIEPPCQTTLDPSVLEDKRSLSTQLRARAEIRTRFSCLEGRGTTHIPHTRVLLTGLNDSVTIVWVRR